jgi:hypothetical protein
MKRQGVAISLDSDPRDCFQTQSQESGIPYQALINLSLSDCAAQNRQLQMKRKGRGLRWFVEKSDTRNDFFPDRRLYAPRNLAGLTGKGAQVGISAAKNIQGGDRMDKYEKIAAMWREWKVETAADIDLRLHNFRILFAYHSGKIENPDVTYSDTREIFENGRVVNYTGEPGAVFELKNQKLCYEFLKHKIAAREPLTAELVKETHAILTGGTYDERRYVERGERPGAFKKHDYVTGREEVGSMPEDVPADVDFLLGEIRDFGGKEIIKAAAYFHARFEYIHPFADGNGRVGRTLLNYFLMINGHPPVIVHDEDRAGYYAALEAYDRTEDISPLCGFLVSQTEKTWEKSLEREERRAARPVSDQAGGIPSVIRRIRTAQKETREQPCTAPANKRRDEPER